MALYQLEASTGILLIRSTQTHQSGNFEEHQMVRSFPSLIIIEHIVLNLLCYYARIRFYILVTK
jgi:hypothetical protein